MVAHYFCIIGVAFFEAEEEAPVSGQLQSKKSLAVTANTTSFSVGTLGVVAGSDQQRNTLRSDKLDK